MTRNVLVRAKGPHYDVVADYEPEVQAIYRRFVVPGDCAVDVGASLGHHTVALAGLVGPSGLVLAFEPNGESFEHLERNIAMRGLENIAAFEMALWHEETRLRLNSIDELGYTSICHYVGTRYTETVDARSLDQLVPPGLAPDFIKIDCEMAEFEVLRGAEGTLRAFAPAVVLEFNYNLLRQCGSSDRSIRAWMADLGYEMFLINIAACGGGYCPPIHVPLSTEIELRGAEVLHMNVLFSTIGKVRELWKTCDTSRPSTQSFENSSPSQWTIIVEPAA